MNINDYITKNVVVKLIKNDIEFGYIVSNDNIYYKVTTNEKDEKLLSIYDENDRLIITIKYDLCI